MRRLLAVLLCLMPALAVAQTTGTVINGDQVMVGGRRLSDALDLKADKAPLAAALLAKADRLTTNATTANKVDLSTFTSALAGKVDTGTYSAGLSSKADQAVVISALAAKANSMDVAASISAAVTPLAPTASPTFTGNVRAPTVAAGDSSAKVATTSFVGTAVTTALATLAPIAPTFGTSVGGEIALAAPAAVPTAAPFWVRVTFGGIVQRPGVDFTSNGTTTITLATPLDPGVGWMVEQLQRNPS